MKFPVAGQELLPYGYDAPFGDGIAAIVARPPTGAVPACPDILLVGACPDAFCRGAFWGMGPFSPGNLELATGACYTGIVT
jgi:hypothetical protein